MNTQGVTFGVIHGSTFTITHLPTNFPFPTTTATSAGTAAVTTAATTAATTFASSVCVLSPSAAAFSSGLSAFVGSVLNGLFSGYWVAFVTGWISWFAFMRIIAAGLYELYLALKAGLRLEDVDTQTQYATLGVNMGVYPTATTTAGGTQETTTTPLQNAYGIHDEALERLVKSSPAQGKLMKLMFGKGPPARTVTFFGWLGWIWSGVYTPISHSIWLAVNISSGAGPILFVRALAITVSALGLTFDYKQRYAASLGRKWGRWAFMTFNIWNAAACLLLGLEALSLLIVGMVRVNHNLASGPVIAISIVYVILSTIWATVSWRLMPPIDAARPGTHIVFDVLMGAFAGLFVAAPATALRYANPFGQASGMSLGEFLNCEGASVARKFAAVMP